MRYRIIILDQKKIIPSHWLKRLDFQLRSLTPSSEIYVLVIPIAFAFEMLEYDLVPFSSWYQLTNCEPKQANYDERFGHPSHPYDSSPLLSIPVDEPFVRY
jgi:hypothetical protein